MEQLNIIYVWLLAGVALVIIDTLHTGGIGLMFAGLGALVTGACLQMQLIAPEAYVTQFLVCFAATAAWALLLWKPMLKFRHRNTGPGYSNIIGETAYVGSQGLSKSAGGEVTWSGTIMKAQLAKHVNTDRLDAGTQVTIVEISGATLIVKPKD